MTFDTDSVITHPDGGCQSLSDYCNCQPRGDGLRYSACLVTADEELLVGELGQRVVVELLDMAIDGWSAFWTAHYDEHMRSTDTVDEPATSFADLLELFESDFPR